MPAGPVHIELLSVVEMADLAVAFDITRDEKTFLELVFYSFVNVICTFSNFKASLVAPHSYIWLYMNTFAFSNFYI